MICNASNSSNSSNSSNTCNVTFIQKIYRGYKLRNRMKYYKNCSDDIQRRIIRYIRDDFYNNKFNNSVANIILNKVDTFIKKYYLLFSSISHLHGCLQWYSNLSQHLYPTFNVIGNELFYIFYLLDKYSAILVNKLLEYNYVDHHLNNYINDYAINNKITMLYKLYLLSEKLKYEMWNERNKNGLSTLENFKYAPCVRRFYINNMHNLL